MGSPIDSSRPAIRDSTNGGDPLRPSLSEAPLTGRYEFGGTSFARFEGCYKKNIKELWPLLPDEHGDYQAIIAAQECLQRPPAPQAPVPNAVDAFYEAEFRRLELALEASMAKRTLVPSSVTEGSVATLGVVGMAIRGEAVFGSVLEEHVPADKVAK